MNREELIALFIEAGMTFQSASAQASRRKDWSKEDIVFHYSNHKSKYSQSILAILGTEPVLESQEEKEEKALLNAILNDAPIPDFPRLLAENDAELISRYLVSTGMSEKKARYLSEKCTVDGKVKVSSKYFALCNHNK